MFFCYRFVRCSPSLYYLCLEGGGGESVGKKEPSKTTIKSVFILYTKFSYRLRVALSDNTYSEILFVFIAVIHMLKGYSADFIVMSIFRPFNIELLSNTSVREDTPSLRKVCSLFSPVHITHFFRV